MISAQNKVILDILKRLTAIERNVRNLIKIGNVKEVIGAKVVIDYEPNSDNNYFSPPIMWLSKSAGDEVDWRAPSIGEQMIVINLSGGENEAHAIALPSLYSADFFPDTLDPTKKYTSFFDVFRVTTDSQGNHLVEAEGSVKFITPSFMIEADSVVSIETPQYNCITQTMNSKGKHTHNGDVAIKGMLDVSVSIKTPAIASYTPGAFSMSAAGAIISNAEITSAKINGIVFEVHTHPVTKEGQPTGLPQ